MNAEITGEHRPRDLFIGPGVPATNDVSLAATVSRGRLFSVT